MRLSIMATLYADTCVILCVSILFLHPLKPAEYLSIFPGTAPQDSQTSDSKAAYSVSRLLASRDQSSVMWLEVSSVEFSQISWVPENAHLGSLVTKSSKCS